MIFLYKNMKIYFCIALAILTLMPEKAFSRARVAIPASSELTLGCLQRAATLYHVPLAVLMGILAVEGGRAGQALENTNATWDMGPFQINTCHVDFLLEQGINPDMVLANPCLNAQVAAQILSMEWKQRADIWAAVGAYHSPNVQRSKAYTSKVISSMGLLAQGRAQALIEFINGRRSSWQ